MHPRCLGHGLSCPTTHGCKLQLRDACFFGLASVHSDASCNAVPMELRRDCCAGRRLKSLTKHCGLGEPTKTDDTSWQNGNCYANSTQSQEGSQAGYYAATVTATLVADTTLPMKVETLLDGTSIRRHSLAAEMHHLRSNSLSNTVELLCRTLALQSKQAAFEELGLE